ncbi:hypothetical protein GE09DRAFT_1132456 [Coniochaeta sp. 2T2.1]|nr:hypothetical protein GE09DRAFT_1132456 [Coniochaeta sp. 2T2.1]
MYTKALLIFSALSLLSTAQVAHRPLVCHNNAGDDVPCTCDCAENPGYGLGSVHPYEVGQAVWCYMNEAEAGLGQPGHVGCFVTMDEGTIIRDAIDNCISADGACFCCDTNCGPQDSDGEECRWGLVQGVNDSMEEGGKDSFTFAGRFSPVFQPLT